MSVFSYRTNSSGLKTYRNVFCFGLTDRNLILTPRFSVWLFIAGSTWPFYQMSRRYGWNIQNTKCICCVLVSNRAITFMITKLRQ